MYISKCQSAAVIVSIVVQSCRVCLQQVRKEEYARMCEMYESIHEQPGMLYNLLPCLIKVNVKILLPG